MSTVYAGNSTRPHFGGIDSDIDQHLEMYDGIRDTQFQHTAIFTSMSTQRSTKDNTNNYRIDRLNTSQVKGRGVGEDVISQRVTSDKMNIIVDTMLYIRNPIDYMDDWTAPDVLSELSQNNGTEFAIAYDQAHIIRLIKARDWVAPAHLKPAFNDGMSVDVTVKGGTALTETDLEQNATALYVAIGKIVTQLTKRRVPMSDMVCMVTPERFEELTHHPKLLNKDYVSDNGDFANRRVMNAQGLNIVECTTFPDATETNALLSTAENGNAFDVTAEDLKGQIIVFSKKLSLVTVTAQPFTSDFWDDKREKTFVLDCHAMYTVDVRRADTVGVVLVTEETTP